MNRKLIMIIIGIILTIFLISYSIYRYREKFIYEKDIYKPSGKNLCFSINPNKQINNDLELQCVYPPLPKVESPWHVKPHVDNIKYPRVAPESKFKFGPVDPKNPYGYDYILGPTSKDLGFE